MRIDGRKRPQVLVSAASKYGATQEIADHIGTKLREIGLDAAVRKPVEVENVAAYDAIVLGGAVYMGHWMKDAKELAVRILGLKPHPPIWMFSSGPVGDPPKPDEEPVDVAEIAAMLSPQDQRLFGGKLDRSKLKFTDRAVMTAVRATEGDYRDWTEIAAWATEIAANLTAPSDEQHNV